MRTFLCRGDCGAEQARALSFFGWFLWMGYGMRGTTRWFRSIVFVAVFRLFLFVCYV